MSTKTTTRKLDTDLLGRETNFEYSETWIGYSILALRLVMGWTFLQAGLDKFLQGDWSAAGFLDPATPFGVTDVTPFASFFHTLGTDYVGIIDPLNMYGQMLIGVALILGVFVRWSAFWGAVMMLFYWVVSLQGGLLAGLPLEHGWVVDDHIVYAALLFGLGAIGAGRILGLDTYLEETEFVQNNRWLRYLLG